MLYTYCLHDLTREGFPDGVPDKFSFLVPNLLLCIPVRAIRTSHHNLFDLIELFELEHSLNVSSQNAFSSPPRFVYWLQMPVGSVLQTENVTVICDSGSRDLDGVTLNSSKMEFYEFCFPSCTSDF
jgi:hypothetical protein